MQILVLGVSGMFGHTVYRLLSEHKDWDVRGSARSEKIGRYFPPDAANKIVYGIDVENPDALARLFDLTRPKIVINCVGVIKQIGKANDPLVAIPINALLPHRLAELCEAAGARLIQISTDCVFSGTKGGYRESDPRDPQDLYGQSKLLGEVDYPHAITLRTSIIGHELESSRSLVEWFLSQKGSVKGYRKAIYSGLPTVEMTRIISEFVIPNPKLRGVFHVASSPISKYDLLHLIAAAYAKKIDIIPDDSVIIDRSLNADKFHAATGYVAPPWPEMVKTMHENRYEYQEK
jgi:dTDP-4-dehydrorhamnose reductase